MDTQQNCLSAQVIDHLNSKWHRLLSGETNILTYKPIVFESYTTSVWTSSLSARIHNTFVCMEAFLLFLLLVYDPAI